MRYLLIAIYKKAVVWFSIMMIPYCVFSSFLEEYPSLYYQDNTCNCICNYSDRGNDELSIFLYRDSSTAIKGKGDYSDVVSQFR